MTPGELTGARRELYDDFIRAGLTVQESLDAACDWESRGVAERVRLGRTFNGLSEVDAGMVLAEAGRAASKRACAVRTPAPTVAAAPLTEASYDARSARVYGRPARGI